jgi:nucleoid-associated protein YgaU
MALAKLKLLVEDKQGVFSNEIAVLFNPGKLTFVKNARWAPAHLPGSDSAAQQFLYGEPAILTTELFFDTYEAGTDVQEHTRKIFVLTTVEEHGELHRPPLVRLIWGQNRFDELQWVLQTLNQVFTLFLADGTPVRANLTCTFRQWRSDEVEQKLLDKHSPDVAKTRTVLRGETLAGIAAEEYNDPALWRPIAEANGIDNPRRVQPGQVLSIPRLVPGTTSRR